MKEEFENKELNDPMGDFLNHSSALMHNNTCPFEDLFINSLSTPPLALPLSHI